MSQSKTISGHGGGLRHSTMNCINVQLVMSCLGAYITHRKRVVEVALGNPQGCGEHGSSVELRQLGAYITHRKRVMGVAHVTLGAVETTGPVGN